MPFGRADKRKKNTYPLVVRCCGFFFFCCCLFSVINFSSNVAVRFSFCHSRFPSNLLHVCCPFFFCSFICFSSSSSSLFAFKRSIGMRCATQRSLEMLTRTHIETFSFCALRLALVITIVVNHNVEFVAWFSLLFSLKF